MPGKNLIIGILAVTGIMLFGGIYLVSRNQKPPEKVQLILDNSWKTGAENGTTTLLEFGDFQCPSCQIYESVVKQLLANNKQQLTFVFRHFPLPQHSNAKDAAYAAEAAGTMGKFWEMYEKLYEQQTEWSGLTDAPAKFAEYAESMGLDKAKFLEEMKSEAVIKKVQQDLDDALNLQINSTPTFYLNGEKMQIPDSPEKFNILVNAKVTPVTKHGHADISVVINNKPADLGKSEGILHLVNKGAAISDLIEPLGIKWQDKCLETADGKKYCSGGNNDLVMYVNGLPSVQNENYAVNDLDKILVIYGNYGQTQIQSYIKSVSDKACIYSEKCPERGPAPQE
jgi:protein-disulfide isomerase